MFTIGLDLGQAQDFSALVVLESAGEQHAAIEIRRWPLGTPYPKIITDVRSLLAHPRLVEPALVVDATGVGRPVVEMFYLAGIYPTAVMITSGMQARQDDNGFWLVPKRELVSTVQVELQSQRLKIAKALPNAALLTDELLNFQAKITDASNDVYGEWRAGKHDDLVLALALALWQAKQGGGWLLA